MREEKRKRLESKGWRVGNTREFLDLSPDEEAYIELRLRLANGLKKRRLRRNLTQTDLAKIVRSSQSRVAKMESGDLTVSLDLLIRSLLALGASRKDVAQIISDSKSISATPSRSGALRPLSPLRTVRDSFPSHGSSISKATLMGRPGCDTSYAPAMARSSRAEKAASSLLSLSCLRRQK